MRIKGYGTGQQGRPGSGRDRADAFRARHSIGERLKGRVLRRDPSGLYWVQVGGEELLARLELETDPGDFLLFVVRALVPEIRLQALQGDAPQDDLPGLVQAFRAVREVFETQAAPLLQVITAIPPLLAQRQEAFTTALAGDEEAAALYGQAQALLERINRALHPENGGVALYEPWLLPGIRQQEIVRRGSGGFAEASLSGRMAGCGGVEVRLMSRAGECSLRVLAERPEQTGPLQVELAALVRDGLKVEAQFLGVARLAASAGAGVLAELLGDAPRWASGGLNTRV
ncbi:MAG: hypothetical protein CVU73_01370 [Deltaproteobacteria bacterium HGW-Deltaproteobacteria-8]|jgi:hypothetical protein|nr:MAG: hypothetical protein CVU73_01370 [Deltaproteobacteria bacterium HGW-Deltaproteobacteria-8]